MSHTIDTPELIAFSAHEFRAVMSNYPTGVTTVTGIDDNGDPQGMVIGSFSSVSLEPPLVSFMPMKTSSSYQKLQKIQRLSINVLAGNQLSLCRELARKDSNKFDNVAWTKTASGCVALEGELARIEVSIVNEVEAGDHLITICAVNSLETKNSGTPLLFFQGGYGSFTTNSVEAYVDERFLSMLQYSARFRPALRQIAQKYDCEASIIATANEKEFLVIASEFGGTAQVNERIGVRLPLYPPLGEALVIQSDQLAERWVGAAGDAHRTSLEHSIERARNRGYSGISIPDTHSPTSSKHDKLIDSLRTHREWHASPASERNLRDSLIEHHEIFTLEQKEHQSPQQLISLSIPVASSHAESSEWFFALRIDQLPEAVNHNTAASVADDLQKIIRGVLAV